MSRSAGRILSLVFLALLACSGEDTTEPSRSFRMGFQNLPPRPDIEVAIETLEMWTPRADAALILTEVPWAEILGGVSPVDYVVAQYKGLTDYYRQKNIELYVYLDPQNGLDRSSDALALQQLGRSIAEPEMQAVFRRFAVVMDSVLTPEHVGLALETNLIRDAAPAAIYQGVKDAANGAAIDLKARGSQAALSVSVQVDHAWGMLVGGTFQGIDQDFEDFAFLEELGLSSYPYFGFGEPSEIPAAYYSRLLEGHDVPVLVSEGGWSTESLTFGNSTIYCSEQEQEAYMEVQANLLAGVNAIAWFQTLFADLDVSAFPQPQPDNLQYFIYLGMTDPDLQPKPALAEWDRIFSLPLRQ